MDEITDENELPEFYQLPPIPTENGQQPSIRAADSLAYQSPDSTFPLTLLGFKYAWHNIFSPQSTERGGEGEIETKQREEETQDKSIQK